MEIKDLNGRNIRISKNSITCKGDNGKTCGVVRNTTLFGDLQPNKRLNYFRKLRQHNIWGSKFVDCNKEVVIKDNEMYIFHNIHSRLFYEKYGFIAEGEKEKQEEKENFFSELKEAGVNVVEYTKA